MVTTVNGHSFGAPSGACQDITPQHGLTSSTTPVPYEVDISEFPCQSYIPTKAYKCKCKATNNDDICL